MVHGAIIAEEMKGNQPPWRGISSQENRLGASTLLWLKYALFGF
jgi:hypothetical protein